MLQRRQTRTAFYRYYFPSGRPSTGTFLSLEAVSIQTVENFKRYSPAAFKKPKFSPLSADATPKVGALLSFLTDGAHQDQDQEQQVIELRGKSIIHRYVTHRLEFEDVLEKHGLEREKLELENTWQWTKQARLYSDLFQTLKRKQSIALDSQQRTP